MLEIWLLLATTVGALAAEPFAASSVHDSRYLPEYAVDGRPDTRWASLVNTGRPEHLTIDFGRTVSLDRVTLVWEAAYAVVYELQASDDGQTWRTLRRITVGRGGRVEHTDLVARARWLRVRCEQTGPHALYSIWELELPAEAAAAVQAQFAGLAGLRAAAEAERRAALRQRASQLGLGEVVFAVRHPGLDGHWYANFGYYAADSAQKCYRPNGGRLAAYDPQSGAVRTILDVPDGSVRDPQVHYDGRTILFSMLPSGGSHYHLYEIQADGSGLRQLTDGDCDDLEPSYLPDGDIVFCSSRCNRWVNCWLTPVATIYRCDRDGGHVRMLSANVEHDNTPWPLPDGRILYQRWEYVDRSQVDYHHLWTFNPDGTRQMVYFGNLHPGIAMLDAKPVPGTGEVVTVFSPGHGKREHEGQIALLDPRAGPDERGMAKVIPTGDTLRDPYPLDPANFLVADGSALKWLEVDGTLTTVYELPAGDVDAGRWLHEPRPLAPRHREAVIPPAVQPTRPSGRLIVSAAHLGRNMAGVQPGQIKSLLVIESLPKPINYTGGMDPISYGGTFTLERLIGTVPVEPDGSANFEVPALRSLFLVAQDAEGNAVKRMQSFLTVQPGETMSCVGCHEPRTQTQARRGSLLALRRPPSQPQPLADLPDVFDYPRDVQPILDRHCLPCHGCEPTAAGGPAAGGAVLTGDRGPVYSHSYYTLTWRNQIADGRNEARGNRAPYAIGAAASPVFQKVLQHHHGVQLSDHEVRTLRYWLESGAAYPGTYGALGGGSIGGYYANNLVETDLKWPTTVAGAEVIERRCSSCHRGTKVLPTALSDERDVSFWRPDWRDPRLALARHRVFNLSRPAQSLLLLAPLAKAAGGWERCGTIFTDPSDADYRKLLAMVEAGHRRLGEIKRFDMPGFRPPAPYLREMQRYGVLAALPPPDQAVDSYALDRAYWGLAPRP
ncbi:MAG: discoidin domain-containing protein [Fimbriimonadaceae bacterium]|nr:discoidin domain-containing protein [Fimbriimonadaceae bacterium]